MKGRYKKTNDTGAKTPSLSFAEMINGKPTKKMKQAAGKVKKMMKSSSPEAFLPHEDPEF